MSDLGSFVLGSLSVVYGLKRLGEAVGESTDDFRAALKAELKKRPKRMRMRRHAVRSIDDKISHLRRLANAGRTDLIVRKIAGSVLSRKCGDSWCLPEGTLLLRHPDELVPIENVGPGDVIMGDGEWTRVIEWWDQGPRDLLAFRLNNGTTLRCTPEHKLLLVPRRNENGTVLVRDGKPRRDCAWQPCPGERQDMLEIIADDVRVRDDLLQPTRLPFGRESIGVDRALILGAYIADGWLEPSRASIAGIPNGKGIREEVIAAVKRLGLKFSTDDYKVRLMGRDIVAWLSMAGRHAAEKHVPSLDIDEDSARSLLRGIEADARSPDRSDVKTPTFFTTSLTLARQYRLLQRMFGRSASLRVAYEASENRRILYQVHVRQEEHTLGARKWAKVSSIADDGIFPTFDLRTDSQRIYLPENDIVVHNCTPEKNWRAEIKAIFKFVKKHVRYVKDIHGVDTFQHPLETLAAGLGDCDDFATLLAALMVSVGYAVHFRVIRTKRAPEWDHIFVIVTVPRTSPPQRIALDASTSNPPGWHPPMHLIAEHRDFAV